MTSAITTDEKPHWEGADSKEIRKSENLPDAMVHESHPEGGDQIDVEEYGSRIKLLVRVFYF